MVRASCAVSMLGWKQTNTASPGNCSGGDAAAARVRST
eukprot:CAMPEP_0179181126 /NCGR_PEP_ID=MMETSP0796-20121207/89696_1 /TAXON_ID=73915 /ORGANISM="Pyrodinium bahamense, Strain pbaha01" /LENGTH=37 /DNA_ID= /DNA_START= /DNA_END= /DNA_ORIENTATION=